MNSKAAFAAGAIAALVLGSGTAVAATGGNFILGKANTAGKTTVLTNKNGTALALNSRAGTPPLKVNRPVRVPNLNADRLDGRDASAFASAGARTAYITASGSWYDFTEDGVPDTIIAFATCPKGTVLTGGGVSDFTSTGVLFNSSPLGGRTWAAAVLADPAQDNDTDLEAQAVCMNMRGGSVPGGQAARRPADTTTDREAYLERLAAHPRH
jgi:hypothetical protein